MKGKGQVHTPAILHQGKQNLITIRQETGWASEFIWIWWKGGNLCPCQDLNPGCPVHSLVNIMTALLWLLLTSMMNVWFEVLTTVVMKSSIFRDIMPCSPLKNNQCFRRTCHLLHADFLLGLFFDRDDGDYMFLWNISWLSMDYTVLYPTWQNSSSLINTTIDENVHLQLL
jgi:hypothetical protein